MQHLRAQPQPRVPTRMLIGYLGHVPAQVAIGRSAHKVQSATLPFFTNIACESLSMSASPRLARNVSPYQVVCRRRNPTRSSFLLHGSPTTDRITPCRPQNGQTGRNEACLVMLRTSTSAYLFRGPTEIRPLCNPQAISLFGLDCQQGAEGGI